MIQSSTVPVCELIPGRKIKYCISGMARNWHGKNDLLGYAGHIYGSVSAYWVKKGKSRIQVNTPDMYEIWDGKKCVWKYKD